MNWRPLLCTFLAIGAATPAYADDRADALVNSFITLCTVEPMDYARTDAKAKAMHLQVVQDANKPADANGYYVNAKTWVMQLQSGPHAFMITDAIGPKGHFQSCGIADNNIDGKVFLADLTKALKLNKPTVGNTAIDSVHHAMKWSYNSGELMFVSPAPGQAKSGIYLSLMQVPAPANAAAPTATPAASTVPSKP